MTSSEMCPVGQFNWMVEVLNHHTGTLVRSSFCPVSLSLEAGRMVVHGSSGASGAYLTLQCLLELVSGSDSGQLSEPGAYRADAVVGFLLGHVCVLQLTWTPPLPGRWAIISVSRLSCVFLLASA